ncbi:unnamed protein product [Fraxinus pennsylvanica]|uniref:Uncharacterized protein n=1 Tax=Fraxinus pennsylvanica TaxID=56036 RepID=A0AAD2DQV2_9LAMI|nr:unnamed protein product [Fraxinus pennsylvanica]
MPCVLYTIHFDHVETCLAENVAAIEPKIKMMKEERSKRKGNREGAKEKGKFERQRTCYSTNQDMDDVDDDDDDDDDDDPLILRRKVPENGDIGAWQPSCVIGRPGIDAVASAKTRRIIQGVAKDAEEFDPFSERGAKEGGSEIVGS